MRILLTTRIQKTVFTVLLLVLGSAYAWWVLVAYYASRLAAKSETAVLQKAVVLEPDNAEYHDLLGNHLFFAAQDGTSSIAEYQVAVRLNPHVAHYWLDLARAQLTAGNVAQMRAALAHAVAADPRTPNVLWEAANDYLVVGSTEQALPYIRTVLEFEPSRTSAAITLCWRMLGDVNLMLTQALPPRANVYLAFMKTLLSKDEATAAAQVWSALLTLRQPPAADSAFFYIQYLIEHHEPARAASAWRELPHLAPKMQRYMPSDNLVVNGRFAEDLLNAGFDWRYQQIPHVNVTLDDGRREGQRSLAVAFDGDTVDQTGVYQFIPLEPDTRYEFSAWVRSDNVLGVTGPRLAIQDAYGSDVFVQTDAVLGTTAWKELKAEFTAPHGASLGTLKIAVPDSTHVAGTLWMTDLRLTKLPVKS